MVAAPEAERQRGKASAGPAARDGGMPRPAADATRRWNPIRFMEARTDQGERGGAETTTQDATGSPTMSRGSSQTAKRSRRHTRRRQAGRQSHPGQRTAL